MGRLDVEILRYLSSDALRLLTSVEMGMKNHEFVNEKLVKAISGLRCGDSSIVKQCKELCRQKLLAHSEHGYRLTNAGYDCLALKALVNAGNVSGIGQQIGVGKESDVYLCENDAGDHLCLKVHRLGRTSFRQLKNKRDYLGNRSHFNWIYLSRLSAEREYSFLLAMHKANFPVPRPIGNNRHVIVMEYIIDNTLLNNLQSHDNPMILFTQCQELLERMASCGLVHGDFNEFNLLIAGDTVRVIDLPQCVSRDHPNAEDLYNRDRSCILNFFHKRFGLEDLPVPQDLTDVSRTSYLDRELRASGFKKGAESADSDISDSESESDESDSLSHEEVEEQQSECDSENATAKKDDKSKSPSDAYVRRRVRAERFKELRKAGLRAGRRQAKHQRNAMNRKDMHEELVTWG